MLKSFCIAFSMFSRIPMPNVKWDERGMKYALCFFPVVGLVIGLISYILAEFLYARNVNTIFFACVMTCLPIILTGGIHFDGFLDTVDGLNSFGDIKKRLGILSDPHCGAFAVIWGIFYAIFTVGCWCQFKKENLFFVCIGYCVSRVLSGLAIVLFPKAKNTGLVATFGSGAKKGAVVCVLVAFLIVSFIILFNEDIRYVFVMAVIGIFTMLYHYHNCIKNFGGITGDTAGYFLQIFELAVILCGGVIL